METRGTLPPSGAEFRMIDVGEKPDTKRVAVASGRFFAKAETLRMIRERRLPKGDVLALAEVAGIQGAKNCASLLPLCHPLPLHSVRVWLRPAEDCIQVFCEASTVGKTGVEMEALTGVSVALLCLHDLAKMIDPAVRFGDVILERKEGGKSGSWVHPDLKPAQRRSEAPALSGRKICLLTISDRCSKGASEDRSGPRMREWFTELGAQVVDASMVPDEPAAIRARIESWLERERPDAVFSSGGTGLSPRDVTPETILAMSADLGGREVQGIGELLRSEGSLHTKQAWLSRSLGVYLRETLVVALPGSEKAVAEGLAALRPVLSHLLHIGHGGDHTGAHEVRKL